MRIKIIVINISLLLFYHCAAVEIATHEIKSIEIKSTKYQNLFELIIEDPYQVNNIWFYPQKYKSFKQIGMANEIKDLEIGAITFNGEHYHPENLMGAHATLPLPSTVNILNIKNGYSVNVRINHRGGFSNTSVVDLSPEVFDLLNLNQTGDLVEISLIEQNDSFILKKAKTYHEEKLVDNAPVLSVSIEGLEKNKLVTKSSTNETDDIFISDNLPNSFKIDKSNNQDIYLKIGQFIFLDTAKTVKESFDSNLDLKILETFINKKKYYNVVVGPFIDIDKLLKVLDDEIFKDYEDLSIILI